MECPYCNQEMRLGEIAGVGRYYISWKPDPEKGHELDGESQEKPVRLTRLLGFTRPRLTTFHCAQCDKLVVDTSSPQAMDCPYCKVDMRRGIIIARGRTGRLVWRPSAWSLERPIELNVLLVGAWVAGTVPPMLPFRASHCMRCNKFIA